jgi:hypothetical protein
MRSKSFYIIAIVVGTLVLVVYLTNHNEAPGKSIQQNVQNEPVASGREVGPSSGDSAQRTAEPSMGENEPPTNNRAFRFNLDPSAENWRQLSRGEKLDAVQSFCLTGKPQHILGHILEQTNPGALRGDLLRSFGEYVRSEDFPPSKIIEVSSSLDFDSEKQALAEGVAQGIRMVSYKLDINGLRELTGNRVNVEGIVDAFVTAAPFRLRGVNFNSPSAGIATSVEVLELSLREEILSREQIDRVTVRQIKGSWDALPTLDHFLTENSSPVASKVVMEAVVSKAAREAGVGVLERLLEKDEVELVLPAFKAIAGEDPTTAGDWYSNNKTRLSSGEKDLLAAEMVLLSAGVGEVEVSEAWMSEISDPQLKLRLERETSKTILPDDDK